MKRRLSFCIILVFLQVFSTTWAQTVGLSKTVFAPTEKITVSFSGFPGNSNDWIGLAAAGSEEDKYVLWSYLGGQKSGTVTFNGLPYGNYEVRGYYNNEGTVRARMSFKVGNADANLSARTLQPNYKPYEKITVQYSGLPGNSRDWIGLATVGSADDKYVVWAYTDGKQSGTMELNGIAEGNYEVRVYFNNESTVRSRYPFTVSTNPVSSPSKLCRNELSTFYAGMNSLGLCWGRLGSEIFSSTVINNVQATLPNVIAAIQTVPCADFDVNKIRDFSSRLPSLTQVQAVNEIDKLIKEILASLARANVQCDNGTSLISLFTAAVHLGAAQAIANSFVCRMIPPEWQTNIINHLNTARDGLSGFRACIPSFNFSVFGMVPVSAGNAYEPVTFIIGIHTQVLWTVSLTNCCCYCK